MGMGTVYLILDLDLTLSCFQEGGAWVPLRHNFHVPRPLLGLLIVLWRREVFIRLLVSVLQVGPAVSVGAGDVVFDSDVTNSSFECRIADVFLLLVVYGFEAVDFVVEVGFGRESCQGGCLLFFNLNLIFGTIFLLCLNIKFLILY